MRLLLDTHVFLWAAANPSLLTETAREAIEDNANDVFVSAAVAWEIIIKYQAGRLSLPLQPATYVPARMSALGFTPLPFTQEHALAVASLPSTHADPFDRMMIAQAQFEGLTLVTRDAASLTYPVRTIKA